MSIDLTVVEADVQTALTQLHALIAPLEAMAPILATFLPKPQAAVLMEAVAIIKGIQTAAPDMAKNIQAVITDVRNVLAAIETSKQ